MRTKIPLKETRIAFPVPSFLPLIVNGVVYFRRSDGYLYALE